MVWVIPVNSCTFIMMFKAENHIRNIRHIVLMWFILFALSPCVVKGVLLSAANAAYSKPLKKSKTTAPTSSCQYSQNENQQIPVVKQPDTHKEIEPFNVSENLFFVVRFTKINGKYSKTPSGNSLPKYILYKCLKLDVA